MYQLFPYAGVVSDGEWLDQREARAWRGFLEMHGRLRSRLGRALHDEVDLSYADYEVLVHLSEAPDGRARAFELADATQWEKSRLSHQLTRMAARGLVRRERCPSDRRGSFVVLTEEGWDAIRSAAPNHVGHVRRWFIDALTPADLDRLGDISDRVIIALAEDDEVPAE